MYKHSYNCNHVSSIITNIIVSIHISKIMTNLEITFYVDKEMQDILKEFYLIKRNLVIQHIFINFLEDGTRYEVEIFRVN